MAIQHTTEQQATTSRIVIDLSGIDTDDEEAKADRIHAVATMVGEGFLRGHDPSWAIEFSDEEKDADDKVDWRQTTCTVCGQDIEGDANAPDSGWCDRGANETGSDGHAHVPNLG